MKESERVLIHWCQHSPAAQVISQSQDAVSTCSMWKSRLLLLNSGCSFLRKHLGWTNNSSCISETPIPTKDTSWCLGAFEDLFQLWWLPCTVKRSRLNRGWEDSCFWTTKRLMFWNNWTFTCNITLSIPPYTLTHSSLCPHGCVPPPCGGGTHSWNTPFGSSCMPTFQSDCYEAPSAYYRLATTT